MTVLLYGIPNCDTVKKARTWLADNGQEFEFHDFKKQGLDRATVAHWLEQHEDPETKIGRPRQIYVGADRREYVPIARR